MDREEQKEEQKDSEEEWEESWVEKEVDESVEFVKTQLKSAYSLLYKNLESIRYYDIKTNSFTWPAYLISENHKTTFRELVKIHRNKMDSIAYYLGQFNEKVDLRKQQMNFIKKSHPCRLDTKSPKDFVKQNLMF
jgi:helix-turn-helix protein